MDYLIALAPIAVLVALAGAVMRAGRLSRPSPPNHSSSAHASPAPASGGGRGAPRCGP